MVAHRLAEHLSAAPRRLKNCATHTVASQAGSVVSVLILTAYALLRMFARPLGITRLQCLAPDGHARAHYSSGRYDYAATGAVCRISSASRIPSMPVHTPYFACPTTTAQHNCKSSSISVIVLHLVTRSLSAVRTFGCCRAWIPFCHDLAVNIATRIKHSVRFCSIALLFSSCAYINISCRR